MSRLFVQRWYISRYLDPVQVDCIIAVMLKILDGKCKMSAIEKEIMILLYDCLDRGKGSKLGSQEHELIGRARLLPDDETLKIEVYEKRLLAETMISRPVMKVFKSMLRREGLFGSI